MARIVPYNRRNIDLSDGSHDIYNMVDDFLADSWPFRGGRNMPAAFKMDVQDNEKEYVVEAELPGVDKSQLSIDLEDGTLSISVKHEDKIDETGKNFVHRERRLCSMERSVYLPEAASDNVKAKLENGVLSVNVPKAAEPVKKSKIDIE